jgi:hypothetical protein
MEIAVQWLDRTAEDSERRTFEVWEWEPRGPQGQQFTFNSSELREVNFEMHPVAPLSAPLVVVARERCATAAAADARRRSNASVVRRAVHEVIAPPPSMRRTLPKAEENDILSRCV